MRLTYAIPLLIALGLAWLVVRHLLEQRRERQWRERLRRHPKPPKFKARGESERSEMRASEDATTVARTIKQKPKPGTAPPAGRLDGTRSPR